MTHIIRPPSEFLFPAADALLNFPRCIEVLESAVRDVLIHFWDDPFRQRAQAIARSLSEGCRSCGFRESSGLLRSLESLLALTVKDIQGIQRPVAERIFDVLALLKEQASKTRRVVEDPS